MLEQENYADKELVVGSLKVLGNVSGRESEKVRQNLEMLQNTIKSQQARQDNYWNSLTADGVISAVEKKQLKKEFEGIEQTHTALMKQASDKGILDSTEIQKYDAAFLDLKEYLFTKLQLFKRMTEKTEIESSDIFNQYYSDYYFALQNAQARVTIGEPGKIRVLSSLTEPGTDEEVALYENNFYRYDLQNHEWIGISVASKLGEYMGVRTDSPPQVLNQYFLVGKGGITGDFLEFIPEGRAQIDNAWTDENGNIIFINYGFEEGYIYFWNDRNEFEKVEDRNNWRYIIALNDLRANGFEVSPELYEWLTIDIAKEIETSLQDKVYENAPKYERVKRLPENPNNGDWILWDAASTSRFTKGHVYLYQKATVEWIELDPKDESGAVRSKLMAALTDILEVNQADTVGYFSTVFASAFFSNTATIKSLATRTIEIEADGMINSRGYVRGQSGWFIKGNGEAQFGKVEISEDGNVRINNGYFSGNVEATSGTFRGTIYATDGTFRGTIYATDGEFSGELDCGALQVRRENLIQNLQDYLVGTDYATLWRYFNNLYGYNKHFSASDEYIYYGDMRVISVQTDRYQEFREQYLYRIIFNQSEDNQTVLSFIAGSYPEVSHSYIDVVFHHFFYNQNFLTLLATNLPKYRPNIENVLWNNNGILSIS